jgi:hypothetical protein
MKTFILNLPKPLLSYVPRAFIDELSGQSGMVSIEADRIEDQLAEIHPCDDPRAAMVEFVKHATEFLELLTDVAKDVTINIDFAKGLLESDAFAEDEQ